ncbi:MAG: ribosome biogenesis GTPase Der [Candidatus Sericytochromatia bacterium]|nr:ribosome biogenesis GTPase Der [Candidatus Sericytochromatia bacterium]
MPLPTVAVVGRPNVGKSTFTNRLVGRREAIVHDEPGVTRDRQYLKSDWNGREFIVIDTGGIVPGEREDEILRSIRKQAEAAVEEADVILLMVDAKQGLTPADEEIAQFLRSANKPVMVVANKVDNVQMEADAAEFYELGLGTPHGVSSVHGLGVGDLLDEVVGAFPPADGVAPADELKVAIVGRPNVGKSSLTNRLLGEERMIVSDVAGTTRDAIDSLLTHGEKRYLLVDTAGIRKRAKVDYGVEQFAVVRSLKAIERADVVVMVIDATVGVTEQDQRIAGMADDAGKPCVLVVNKWDLVPKDTYTMEQFKKALRDKLHHIDYAPMLFTSAATGQRVSKLLELAEAAAQEAQRRITTGLLNQVITEAIALNSPPTNKGRGMKVYYATQVRVGPPAFVLFVNDPGLVSQSYTRYLENKLREAFGFVGTPIRVVFRERREKDRHKR